MDMDNTTDGRDSSDRQPDSERPATETEVAALIHEMWNLTDTLWSVITALVDETATLDEATLFAARDSLDRMDSALEDLQEQVPAGENGS